MKVLLMRKIRSKVLVLTPELKVPGGVSNFFEALCLDQYVNINYFFISFSREEKWIESIYRLLRNYYLFIKILQKGEVSVVHANPSLNIKSFLRDGLYVFIAQAMNIKTITFFHGWDELFEGKLRRNMFLKWFFSKTFQKSEHILVLSKKFKIKLIDLGCSESTTQFHLLTTVADTSFIQDFSMEAKFNSYDDEIVILFLSRIEKSKGVFIAIKAFDQLQNEVKHLKFKLIVAGDGAALEEAKQTVIDQQIDNIEFTGYVRNDAKKAVLLSSHILLFPTYYGEGMPTNILEGMLYGMPVVSRYNAGIADAVEQGVNGYLTESLDPKVFVNLLKQIVLNKDHYEQIAIKNNQKALEKYSPERVNEKLMSIYNTTLPEKLLVL